MHLESRAEGLRDAVEEIVGEMHGVAGAAAVAAEEHLAAVFPALKQIVAERLDSLPRGFSEHVTQARGIAREMHLRRHRLRLHRTTSRCIHFRLWNRSSSFSSPLRNLCTSSLIASSTVFFGRKPMASRRSELTR